MVLLCVRLRMLIQLKMLNCFLKDLPNYFKVNLDVYRNYVQDKTP